MCASRTNCATVDRSRERARGLGGYENSAPGNDGSYDCPHAYLADDEHGVVLQRSYYRRGDDTVKSNETFVFHFRDGKISEYWVQSDNWDELDAFVD